MCLGILAIAIGLVAALAIGLIAVLPIGGLPPPLPDNKLDRTS